MVLVDVDGFERVNDTHGHQHGDHVLDRARPGRRAAARRHAVPHRRRQLAALLAVGDPDRRSRPACACAPAVAAGELGVTVSIGVAVPQEGQPDGAVLDRADRALYRVRIDGRDGVAVSPPEAPPVVPPSDRAGRTQPRHAHPARIRPTPARRLS